MELSRNEDHMTVKYLILTQTIINSFAPASKELPSLDKYNPTKQIWVQNIHLYPPNKGLAF